MKKLIAIALLFIACTDEDRTYKTLRASGYTNIRTTGYKWGECGEGDTYSTGFVAANARGELVEGTVCCGLAMKGCTVRF